MSRCFDGESILSSCATCEAVHCLYQSSLHLKPKLRYLIQRAVAPQTHRITLCSVFTFFANFLSTLAISFSPSGKVDSCFHISVALLDNQGNATIPALIAGALMGLTWLIKCDQNNTCPIGAKPYPSSILTLNLLS